MKLLFVYQFCSLGGCETVLRNRLVGFRERGISPRVVLLKDVGGGRIFAGFDGVTYPCSTDELFEIVERGGFDCIAALDTPQIYPVLARSHFSGVLITEVHSNRVANIQYLQHVERSATRLILTPSRFEGELIQREFLNLRTGRIPIRVVPNPVDTSLFRFVPPAVPPARKLIGWVGRIEPEKNWRHFLAIAAELARLRSDVDFLVVGGWAVTEDVKREFLEMVKQLGVIDRLKWVSSLDYDRMPRFYSLLAASGGCLVPTSLLEPFGMSVVEAMACGCPVVASRAGAFEELIEDGRTGLTFEVDDTREAVARILSVLDDDTLRSRVVAGGSAVVERRYTPLRVADRYLAVVGEAMSGGPGAGLEAAG